jgi:hypothetical protein
LDGSELSWLPEGRDLTESQPSGLYCGDIMEDLRSQILVFTGEEPM